MSSTGFNHFTINKEEYEFYRRTQESYLSISNFTKDQNMKHAEFEADLIDKFEGDKDMT